MVFDFVQESLFWVGFDFSCSGFSLKRLSLDFLLFGAQSFKLSISLYVPFSLERKKTMHSVFLRGWSFFERGG